jgi:hypothetical protein
MLRVIRIEGLERYYCRFLIMTLQRKKTIKTVGLPFYCSGYGDALGNILLADA